MIQTVGFHQGGLDFAHGTEFGNHFLSFSKPSFCFQTKNNN